MLEIAVMAMDRDGIPRAYASGLVESNDDLDIIKDHAKTFAMYYIAGKSHMDINDFTLVVEIIDES